MAQYQWQFDAPSGTFKQHALSRRLYEAAVEESVFMDYVRPIEGFGRKMGENVTWTRVATITEPTSADLIEGVRIPEDTYDISTASVTVGEIGRAVPYTSLAEDLTYYDLANSIQKKLKEQMKLVLDTKIATALQQTLIKYAVTGVSSNNITTNGTFGAASTANMNVFHCEEIRDYMFDTLRARPYVNDDYVGIFRTLGIRGIKRDPAWEEWHKYTDPQVKYNSEVGRMENIRFIETNHANALAKVGTNSVLGEGVIFGDDPCIMAEVMTPELRAGLAEDFGRSKSVAWYGILAFKLVWDTGNAGEANVIHVGST